MATTALPTSIETSPENRIRPFGLGSANRRPADPLRENALLCAVRLLKSADQALRRDQVEARRCIVEATALLLTAHALSDAETRDAAVPTRGGLAPWQMSRVAAFVDANMTRTIRLHDLAAVTQLSTGYFCQAFRCSTGESPYAYVLRRRVERAQKLMLLTDTPLSQIALDCGLADQPHLTRLFHQIVGVTPAIWRRLRRDGA
jgi:AraC family transcriptional regulator